MARYMHRLEVVVLAIFLTFLELGSKIEDRAQKGDLFQHQRQICVHTASDPFEATPFVHSLCYFHRKYFLKD